MFFWMLLLNEHIPGSGVWDQGAGQAGKGTGIYVFLLKRRKKNPVGVVCATPDRYLSAYRLEQNTGTETGTGVTRRPVANNPFFTPSTLLGISSRVWPGGCNPADIAPGLKWNQLRISWSSFLSINLFWKRGRRKLKWLDFSAVTLLLRVCWKESVFCFLHSCRKYCQRYLLFYYRAGRNWGVLSSACAYPLSCKMIPKHDKCQEKKLNINWIFFGGSYYL